MKTIVNNLRFALLLGFIAIGMTALAQAIPYANKLSATTQLFLQELEQPNIHRAPAFTVPVTPKHPGKHQQRLYASPDTIDGQVLISAFVRVTSDSDISALEALGVHVEAKFKNGLLTTLIPVDRINEVAEIEGVKKISVASLMRPLTDKARQTTNTDDVLTLSNDAVSAGLSKIYDGSGVILGVIDGGIDYQHAAFKDKNGNTRIKGVYNYNGSATTRWTGSGTLPAYDDRLSDHGTHTSSIAGGSSVIVNGSNVTVTDNHANATYGGMAPGSDLFLAGTNNLDDVRIATAMQDMYNYALAEGKPLVVSNSWDSHIGPHDGTGYFADIVNQLFGNNTNNACLFAVGNEAGNADPSEGGGYYISGSASSNNPLGTIVRYGAYSDADNGLIYQGILASAWCRSTSVTSMTCKIHVLDSSTGALLHTVTVNPTTGGAAVNGLSSYYSGTLYAVKDYQETYGTGNFNYPKTQILLFSNDGIQSTSYRQSGGKYISDYTLALEFYPSDGSTATIDVWAGGSYNFFTNYLTTAGHNWVNGSDNMTAGDEVTISSAISVGAYAARNSFTNSQGQTISYSSVLTTNDAVYFSSYATQGTGPTGQQYPTITAPGARVISAINHNHTAAIDADYSYYGDYIQDLVVNSSTNPYAAMDGTSMACPAAAGIVALWMQAAKEVGKNLTVSEIKDIMAQTAIHDSYTDSGSNAVQFGNGKINALGGIEYILREYGVPTITATPTTVTFEGAPGGSYTQTVTVGGIELTGDITATLNDPTGAYSISTTNLGSGGELVITYSPTTQGNHNATITLTNPDADPVTITINGRAIVVTDATVADGTTTNSYLPIYGNQYASKQINQMIYPASMLTEIQGKKIKSMTFYPTAALSFYGGSFNVSVGMTTQATYPQTNYRRLTGLTTVTTGQAAVRNATELVITFDEPFEYTGNNLVVEFEVTATGTSSRSQNFYGVNPNSYTSFNSYGTSTNTYGRYSSGSRRQFLPKVTFTWDAPFTAGEVSPNSLTFSDAIIGNATTQTVTVTNTGNLPFTPVIDTTGLPSEFTVTGNTNVAVGGSIDLTVTYTPANQGPHSGSFTVTIGDVTYTVTVTGNGIIVNSTLYSNEVMVKVYKSNLQANDAIAYSKTDIDNDTDHGLPAKNNSGDVIIQVLGDTDITSYELLRKQEGESTWRSVATANNSNNTYTQVNHADNTVTVADGATAWLALLDDAGITSTQVYYIPVTHALSAQQQDNTYGAQRQSASTTDVSALIYSKVMSSDYGNNEGHTWTVDDKVYTHYTILLDIDNLIIPTSEVDETQDYDLYKVRVWRQIDPAYLAEEIYTATNRLGYNRQERITGDFLMEEVNNDDNPVAALSLSGVHNGTNGNTGFSEYKLGSRDDLETFHSNWTQSGTDEVMGTFGAQKLREYDGETGVIEALPMTFIVRAYYTRTANLDLTAPNSNPNIGQAPRRDGEAADGNFYIVEYTLPFTLDANDSEIVTSVGSIFTERQVVGVTYVNALGQQSDKPFDGVNIVVTRYSDGSITTSKVLK